MKATIDIPDDLYRKVKAKSALEGRPIREITAELYRGWLVEAPGEPRTGQRAKPSPQGQPDRPSWFGALRRYAAGTGGRHDMTSIRRSIDRGRARERVREEDDAE